MPADPTHSPSPISNLPFPPNPNFTGRQQTLDDIHKAFTSNKLSHHVQVLFGPAGVGKTQLASEYAHRHAGEYAITWWIPSDEPASLASSFAALAQALGQNLPQDITTESACRAVRHALGKRSDYLLIFDNAPAPSDLENFIPIQRTGHILITSRNPSWRGMAEPQPLRGLARDDSLAFLSKRTGQPTDADPAARKLASALDDLPLSLDQAAALMIQTGMTYADYLAGYEDQYGKSLGIRKTTGAEYPDSAALAWEMAYNKLQDAMPIAAQLLNLCAFLAPDHLEKTLLRGIALAAPDEMAETLRNVVKFEEIVDSLRKFALAQTSDKSISIHRAAAAMARDRMEAPTRQEWLTIALNGVAILFEFDSHNLQTWTACANLLPHALVVSSFAQNEGIETQRTAELLNEVGRYLHKRAQLPEAKDALEKSLDLSKQAYGSDDPRVSAVANNLGRVLGDLGQSADAMRLYQQALEIDQATYGNDDPKVATIVNNYAKSLVASGDIETARQQFEWALGVYEQHYGRNHPKVAAVINNLGYLLRRTGDSKSASEHFQRALSLVETRYGQQHPHVATIYYNLGLTALEQNDPATARQHLEKALAIDESVYGPTHPAVARDLDHLSLALQSQGQLQDSLQLAQRALRLQESSRGPSNPSLAPLLRRLAQLCGALNDTRQGNAYLTRANELTAHPLQSA